VLERVPTEHFGYRPHPKSMTLGELAAHTANIPGWGTMTLTSSELDFAQPMEQPPAPTTTAELVAAFDAGVAMLRDAVGAAEDEALRATWTARRGEHVVFALPRRGRAAWLHRQPHGPPPRTARRVPADARPPVPSMYGPSGGRGEHVRAASGTSEHRNPDTGSPAPDTVHRKPELPRAC
jgi:hypothetical protein